MKRKNKKRVSALLAALMLASALPGIAVQAKTNASTDMTGAVGVRSFNYQIYTEEDHGIAVSSPSGTLDTTNLPAPVIMSFESLVDMSNSGGRYTDQSGNVEGSHNFVKLADGTKCTRLNYALPDSGTWANYRCMPAIAAGKVTAEHKYVRLTYMTEDPVGAEITILNNATGGPLTIVGSTAVSKGKWVISNAVDMSSKKLPERLAEGKHFTIQVRSNSTNSAFYLKEIAFFASEEQAYAYYGDSPSVDGMSLSALTYGASGTGTTLDGDNYGIHTLNADAGALDITYAKSTNVGANYLAKIKFKNKAEYDADNVYVRVLYSAKNPEGTVGAAMYLRNDGASDIICLESEIVDTNGEYVLSDTVLLAPSLALRFANGLHSSLMVNTTAEGGLYSIKALYFFSDRTSADAFNVTTGKHNVTVAGNDITLYKIVIPEDAGKLVRESAEALVKQIKELTGKTLNIVADSTAVSDYEILVGSTNRPASEKKAKELEMGATAYKAFGYGIDGNSLVITSVMPALIPECVDTFLVSYLYYGATTTPESIAIGTDCTYMGTGKALNKNNVWDAAGSNADPVRFKDSFDADEGYWQEESNAQNFNIENGVMSAKAASGALTYLQVYEPDVTFNAKLSYNGAAKDASFGLMLRYNAEHAYVKAGYDFAAGSWYIESREGEDFKVDRVAAKPQTITADTAYTLNFHLVGSTATLYVNGAQVLTTDKITHLSPGRVAVYANKVDLTADDADVLLLSGEGTIMKNTVHTKLPSDFYLEGGTVFEMEDHSLIYQHGGGTAYKSMDNGLTWTSTERWTDTGGYPNVIRLIDGEWLKVITDGGYKTAFLSSDDGKTWIKGGAITTSFKDEATGISAGAGNMNDKIFQSATTARVFYCQNYEGKTAIDGRLVFCEFFYSDDNGMTWTKSEIGSWEIEGNGNQTYFGECKILECADGTIRMYNSWNQYGCIVYSDSTDNGATWGPLVKMEEFACARSSMQFVRDPYAENDTTYYMVWVWDNPQGTSNTAAMGRSRLSLAKSTDGKNWTYLGDLWRWESAYNNSNGAQVNHIVDPFVNVTEGYVIVGTGASEHVAGEGDYPYHSAQRQHIWSIKKDTLGEGITFNKFTDVALGQDYYNAITYVAEAGLFTGTSDTTFSPAADMTRSMFVTVLGRLDGADTSKYQTPTFKDVAAGQWYTPYVEWAAATGIVNGIGNGLYGTGSNVTVEQVCVMLARYADNRMAAASGKTISDFTDSESVSSWAADGVKWAVENGIYTGKDGKLEPTAPASRAVVATMFYNYVTVFGE